MKRRIIDLLLIMIIFFVPNTIRASSNDSILILVDELSFDLIKDLALEKYSIGLVNYKTRPPYYKENLLLSINTGRKLSLKEFKNKNAKIEYLGDVLKKEKVSYIGGRTEKILVANSKGEVDYELDEINYDLDWLIENTDYLLKKSNILLVSYDFKGEDKRVDILKKYLENYSDRNIIILPEGVAKVDRNLLNKFLVPIIYINGKDSGILTSQSTRREGLITLEDISVHIKSIYGIDYKNTVGKPFEFIKAENPMERIRDIFTDTMNLLILATVFHGLIYFTQFIFSIRLLKYRKIDNWVYGLYSSMAASIPISIVLGVFNLQKNILLYLLICILLSYGTVKFFIIKKLDLIKALSFLIYGLISLGVLFYPKIIYNSFIGFNNLVYGARFYGLNNGIMGVFLISSILIYFSSIEGINRNGYKKILGLFIFTLNMLVLSARFGANTGGFITSIVLFGLMVYYIFSLGKNIINKYIILFLLVIGIFTVNMLFDYSNTSNSHAIEFLYRIKKNGLWEFMTIVSFKAKELFKLTIVPPFSIILASQVLILRKMKDYILENIKLKSKTFIVLITAIVGLLLNDTGPITFIYMMFFFIFDLTNERKYINMID